SQLSSIQLSQIPKDRAAFGSLVTLSDLDSGEELVYELVLAEDGDPPRGKISVSSPIGKALSGREVGEEFVVKTPGGERAFHIVSLVTLHEREEFGTAEKA
ncbi:MAG: transcription elongation factor GreA, partial [Acidobacteria bacterium]|nr:transcription elongation factor GreA [Acidobacteriota bacterium]